MAVKAWSGNKKGAWCSAKGERRKKTKKESKNGRLTDTGAGSEKIPYGAVFKFCSLRGKKRRISFSGDSKEKKLGCRIAMLLFFIFISCCFPGGNSTEVTVEEQLPGSVTDHKPEQSVYLSDSVTEDKDDEDYNRWVEYLTASSSKEKSPLGTLDSIFHVTPGVVNVTEKALESVFEGKTVRKPITADIQESIKDHVETLSETFEMKYYEKLIPFFQTYAIKYYTEMDAHTANSDRIKDSTLRDLKVDLQKTNRIDLKTGMDACEKFYEACKHYVSTATIRFFLISVINLQSTYQNPWPNTLAVTQESANELMLDPFWTNKAFSGAANLCQFFETPNPWKRDFKIDIKQKFEDIVKSKPDNFWGTVGPPNDFFQLGKRAKRILPGPTLNLLNRAVTRAGIRWNCANLLQNAAIFQMTATCHRRRRSLSMVYLKNDR